MHIGEVSDVCNRIQLAEIVKVDKANISDLNEVDREYDCELKRASKIRHRN